MAILVLLNNFLHDFSAAGWLFGAVFLWGLLREPVPAGEAGRLVRRALRLDLRLMSWSLAGIVLFGAVRALAYRQYEWNAAAGENQILLLVIKHVILTGVFVWGLIYFLRARRILREERDETSA
jgi:hypothetical protein